MVDQRRYLENSKVPNDNINSSFFPSWQMLLTVMTVFPTEPQNPSQCSFSNQPDFTSEAKSTRHTWVGVYREKRQIPTTEIPCTERIVRMSPHRDWVTCSPYRRKIHEPWLRRKNSWDFRVEVENTNMEPERKQRAEIRWEQVVCMRQDARRTTERKPSFRRQPEGRVV